MKIIIDLPFPPSINAAWRSNRGRVHLSKKYTKWLADAWGHWLQQKPAQAIKSIKGHYDLEITFCSPDKRRRDLGNLEKCVSDFLQTHGIIENDCFSKSIYLVWGNKEDAPLGMRLFIMSAD